MARYTLLNADSVQAKAGTGGGAINYTISSADEITSGTEVFKVLAQGQLTTSVASLYSPGGATKTGIIQQVLFANTTGSDVTGCAVYVNGTATGNQETGTFTIPANGTAILNKDGLRVLDGTGALKTSMTLSATGDATGTASNGVLPLTLVTVNANVGTYGSNIRIPTYTVNAKGLTTASSDAPVLTTPAGQTPVGATRTLNTTAPITGGGDLSADRTLALTTSPAGQTPVGVTRSIATTAPLTGGGALSSDLTLALAAATTSTAGSQSAVDKAKQDNRSQIEVNILDYGGVGNGSANNDTALANAMAALPSGGIMLFPAGQFNHSTVFTLSGNNIQMKGAGPNATTLHFTQTTGDQLTISGYGSGISDMTVQGPGSGTTSTKASGYGVNLTGTESFAYNIELTYQSNCIGINGPLSEIDHILCRYYGVSAAVVNQNSDHRINRLFTDNALATLPTGAGIDVQVTASLLISNCNIIHANWCLNVSPGAGVTVPSVKGLNCFFDSSVIGLRMASAGSFFRSEFTNCWFSSMSTAGILFAPSTAGTNVDGITFVNCDIYNNVAGTTTGFSVTTANVGKWKMIGCSVAGWTTGIATVAGAAHYPTIEGNTIGSVSAFGVNTTGINIGAGAYGGLVIATNDVNDNTTALTLGAVTITGAAYGKFSITGNPGINPRGTVTPPIATPVTATTYTNNTGFRCSVEVRWVTTHTQLAINGVSYGTGPVNLPRSVTLDPGATILTSGTGAATWFWSGM